MPANGPTVIIFEGRLVCPACGAADMIVEVDVAFRWNELVRVEGDEVIACLGEDGFERDRFECTRCHAYVTLPPDLDVVYGCCDVPGERCCRETPGGG